MTSNLVEKIREFKDTIVKTENLVDLQNYYFSYAFRINELNLDSINISSEKKQSIYFSQPSANFKFIGIGETLSITSTGGSRFLDSKKKVEIFKDKIFDNHQKFNKVNIPLFICAAKFSYLESEDELWDDYQNLHWFIPKFYLLENGTEKLIVFNFNGTENLFDLVNNLNSIISTKIQTNGSDLIPESEVELFESDELWKNKVEYLSERIAEKKYNKVVISRQVILNLPTSVSMHKCIKNLEENYPYCTIFSFLRGGSEFFGASPERLLKLTNGKIEVDALAGSITRGDSKIDDDLLAQKLKSSKKDLFEHKLVVDFIINSLKTVSDKISFNKEPDVRILSNIQHLWTKITAELQNSNSLFDLLYLLHPTPAVCGDPRDTSFKSILEIEPFDRGLYSGFIGWFNFYDHADFTVALRSGLLKNNTLHAFSGCGIVEGSDPQSELEESNLKLTPILSLFQNEKICKSQ